MFSSDEIKSKANKELKNLIIGALIGSLFSILGAIATIMTQPENCAKAPEAILPEGIIKEKVNV